MWTTLNSRAERCALALVLASGAVCLVVSGAGAQAPVSAPPAQVAPDAPRPAPRAEKVRGKALPATQLRIVELKSVSVRRLDERYTKLAGPEFLRTAEAPLAIEVQTRRPLGDVQRDAAPVILLNGEKLLNTWPVASDRLIAFLPDRKKVKDVNSVAVVWLGEARPTLTGHPLTFRREDVPN
jgi:hypothetical protein